VPLAVVAVGEPPVSGVCPSARMAKIVPPVHATSTTTTATMMPTIRPVRLFFCGGDGYVGCP
jgi:hypothetical protein